SQPSSNGSREISVTLVRSVTPHSTPYPTQSRHRSDFSIARVTQRMVAASNAATDASHILSNALRIVFGKKAQSHAPKAATPPPTRLPAKKIGTQVKAEHKMFS